MNHTTVLEEGIRQKHRSNWRFFLSIEKCLLEKHFSWINLQIKPTEKALIGRGSLTVKSKKYEILFSYSPFNKYRYDRIYIRGYPKKYNDRIHVYGDLSLCLYHPIIDQPPLKMIPLYKMIPWIKEWIVYYKQWEKYGVWLGSEIMH